MKDVRNAYIGEVKELLASLETALLSLEKNPNDPSDIENVFRIMHTLKGNSSMFGFNTISDTVHELETIYDWIRVGEMALSKELLDCTFSVLDHLNKIIFDPELEVEENFENQKLIISRIEEMIDSGTFSVRAKQPNSSDSSHDINTYYILFEPEYNFFEDGSNPLFLLEELATLGKCLCVPHFKKIDSFEKLIPTSCYCYWEIYIESASPLNELKDVFVFVENNATLEFTKLDYTGLLSEQRFIEYINQHLYDDFKVDLTGLSSIVAELGTVVMAELPQNVLPESSKEMPVGKEKKKGKLISNVRVSSDKLDELMNLVSELITTQAGLSLYSEKSGNNELEGITENLEKLSMRLRDVAFGMTLVPINNLFGRFERMVRDISSQLGKEIQLVTEGGETELDKSLIESLTDPLMHIIRNSIDHGIEDVESRKKLSKPEQGRIRLKAYYSGVSVYIQISDDGSGIDTEAVKAKAIKNGLISDNDLLSEKELTDLIFSPGFSTSKKVTDISGRGVGMDVVKQSISDLRGSVLVESVINLGTTLTIKLPLTLSIIDGLLVEIEGDKYVIPLSSIVKCYEVENRNMADNFNELLVLDEEQVPFINLRKQFEYAELHEKYSQMVVVSNENRKVGLSVDHIIGEYQAVVKPVSKYYKDQPFVSGATILGDGTIALILDTNTLIELYIESKKTFEKYEYVDEK